MNIPEGTRVVYANTSYLYAALDRRDRDHNRTPALARQVQEQGVGIVTTPPQYHHPYLDLTTIVSFDTLRVIQLCELWRSV